MQVHPIRDDQDYRAALARIDSLMDAVPGSTEEDELDVLATLAEAYEKHVHAILPPDPIEAIKYYMESRGVSLKELEASVGTRSRVNEIMNRRRSLSIKMIRELNKNFQIPAEVLIQPYSITTPTRKVNPGNGSEVGNKLTVDE